MNSEANKKKWKKLIFSSKNSPLDSIPFHKNSEDILRFFSEGFPVHLAVHEIKNASNVNRKYVELHTHKKPEINILTGNLRYKITLGDEEYLVSAPANIWIPPGLKHSATLIEGTGNFICIILNDKYEASEK